MNEQLQCKKRILDCKIEFLFYTEDLADRLYRIRQALDDIEKTGYIQNTASEYIDLHIWSREKYEHMTKTLNSAEEVYEALIKEAEEND